MHRQCSETQVSLRALNEDIAGGAQVTEHTWTHVQQCQECQTYYNRMAYLRRAAEAQGSIRDVPSRAEVLWLQQRVVDRALACGPTFKARQLAVYAITTGRPYCIGLLGVALAAVAVPVILRLPLLSRKNASADVDSPGENSAQSDLSDESTILSVWAFCYSIDTAGQPFVRPLSLDDAQGASERCPKDGLITFAYTAPSATYLSVLILGADGSARWQSAGIHGTARIESAPGLSPLPVQLRCADSGASPRRVAFVFFPAAPSKRERLKVRRRLLQHRPVDPWPTSVVMATTRPSVDAARLTASDGTEVVSQTTILIRELPCANAEYVAASLRP